MITVCRKPPNTYKTLVIDPPWSLCTGGSKTINPKDHYSVQTQGEIISTVNEWLVEHPMAEESHCYIWCINSLNSGRSRGLLDAIDLCEKIGFRPITFIVWVKPNGTPTPFGQRNTELCLFGARWRKGEHKAVMYKGSESENNVVMDLPKSIDYIFAERREHSRKPDEFYDLVESRSAPPYLELYSRTRRFNWTTLGDETDKY